MKLIGYHGTDANNIESIINIGIDASLTYKQAIYAENIYKNFALENSVDPITPDNYIADYVNADMYIETDDILLKAA